MKLWIPGRLPSLNKLLDAKSTQKGNWNSYNDLKCQWFGQIRLLIVAKRVQPVGPGYFTFLFCEPDMRRDPDNVAAGGVKLLFDSFVGAEVMAGDGWKHVLGFTAHWTHTPGKAGCYVEFSEDRLLSKAEMLANIQKEQ